MRKSLKLLMMIVFMLIIVSGCSNSSSKVSDDLEDEFQAIFPKVEMNRTFALKVDSNEKTQKLGSEIPLIFNNQSNDTIYFPTDSFIRIFAVSNGHWVELHNKNTYSGRLVLDPQGTLLKDRKFTGVNPEFFTNGLDREQNDILVRIVLVGEILVDNAATGQLVGSFVDVYVGH